jgi:hypothetical protein
LLAPRRRGRLFLHVFSHRARWPTATTTPTRRTGSPSISSPAASCRATGWFAGIFDDSFHRRAGLALERPALRAHRARLARRISTANRDGGPRHLRRPPTASRRHLSGCAAGGCSSSPRPGSSAIANGEEWGVSHYLPAAPAAHAGDLRLQTPERNHASLCPPLRTRESRRRISSRLHRRLQPALLPALSLIGWSSSDITARLVHLPLDAVLPRRPGGGALEHDCRQGGLCCRSTGIGNTVQSAWLFRCQRRPSRSSSLPCAVIALLLFRPRERVYRPRDWRVSPSAPSCYCTTVYALPPMAAYSAAQYAALARLNVVSAGMLTAFVALLFSNRLAEAERISR